VEFWILGPLEVVEDENPVALGTLKERLVLGVLLLHANEFVSRERLIDDLWGEAPPPTARKAVNVYVSQLRKALGRPGRDPIRTASGGYRLQVEPDAVDANRMQLLVGMGRECVAQGELELAAERFKEALSLWRGPTLAGLQLKSRGRDEVAQLDELRLAVLMDRIDCHLALGRQEEVLGELNVLVREHPLRERLRAQQMLALYRADRQAEALEAYGEARRTLVDDLGIEPSEALQRLQQAILRHDPSLETPEGTAAVNGLARTGPSSQPSFDEHTETGERRTLHFRPRRHHFVMGGVGVLVAAAAAGVVLSTSAARATPPIVANSLVRLDPRSGKIVSVVRLPAGADPGSIAVTPTAIWTTNTGSYTVSRYDLRSHRVQTRGGFSGEPYDIVADNAGNVWVSIKAADVARLIATGGSSAGRQVKVRDASTVAVPPPGAGQLALGGGYLWVVPGPLTLPGDNRVSLVNLATSAPLHTLRLKGDTTGVAFGAGAAWVSTNDEGNGLLYAIPAGTAKARSYRVEEGDSTFGISAGEGGIWLLTWGTNGGVGVGSVQQVLNVDPRTGKVLKRRTFDGQDLWAISAGGGSVWVLADSSVIQLDPRSGRTIRTIPLHSRGHPPTCGIAAANDAVWITMGSGQCGTGSA
jgi:DNA-binding SARP family transcriptional activator